MPYLLSAFFYNRINVPEIAADADITKNWSTVTFNVYKSGDKTKYCKYQWEADKKIFASGCFNGVATTATSTDIASFNTFEFFNGTAAMITVTSTMMTDFKICADILTYMKDTTT